MTNKTHILDISGEQLDKRFAENIEWETTCPSCKAVIGVSLCDLGYTVVGKYYDFNGYCPECDHEWVIGSIHVKIKVIIEEE